MKKQNFRCVVWYMVVAFVFCMCLVSGSAMAQTKNKVVVIPLIEERQPQTVTKYLSVPPAAFNVEKGYLTFAEDYAVVSTDLSAYRVIAPVYFPDGAKPQRMTVWYLDDNDNSRDVNFTCGLYGLSRNEAWSNVAFVTCSEDNSGNKYTSKTNIVLNHTVNNVNNSYMIECKDIGGSLAGEYIQSVLIEYTVVE